MAPSSGFRLHLPRCISTNNTRDLRGRHIVLDSVDDLLQQSIRHFEGKGSTDVYGIAGLSWYGGMCTIETKYPKPGRLWGAPSRYH